VNLERDVIEVYREPAAQGYRTALQAGRDERLVPKALPDLALPVEGILR
jgi:hypothetical protein